MHSLHALSRSTFLFLAIATAALWLGCSSEPSVYRSAITNEACEPDLDTLVDEGEEEGEGPYCWGNNGHGNNADGVDSSNPGAGHGGPNGEIDESCPDEESPECVDDEIHEQHQEDGECVIPEGCDANGCCEEEEPPEEQAPTFPPAE